MLGFFGPAFMFVGWIIRSDHNGPVIMLMMVRSHVWNTDDHGSVVAF